MKPFPLLAALIIAGLPPARVQGAAKDGDPGQDLKGMERAWGDAVVRRDAAAIDRILTDDYILTTPEGQLATKAQVLRIIRSPGDPSFVIKGVDLEEMSIRVFGDTALVSSRFTLKVETEGRIVETSFRHTDVFVKRQDGWRCVSRQATRIRQSYGP
jgi:ketosteroid isomerase-like protein